MSCSISGHSALAAAALRHRVQPPAQLGNLACAGPPRRPPGAAQLDPPPEIKHLGRGLGVEVGDAGALPSGAPHQPLALQPQQRLTHRRLAAREFGREPEFGEHAAGPQFVEHDAAAQIGGQVGGRAGDGTSSIGYRYSAQARTGRRRRPDAPSVRFKNTLASVTRSSRAAETK